MPAKRVIECRYCGDIMRIQEMRSGFSHLKKKSETTQPEAIFKTHPTPEMALMPEPVEHIAASELDELRWAVVSFEKIEACPLTYPQAIAWVDELELRNIPGLCIVTLDAASRVKS